MDLFCLQRKEDFTQFLTRISEVPESEYRVCALSATAAFYLESHNINYISIENFISQGDCKDICIANFKLCEKLCAYLDNKLLQSPLYGGALRENSLKPFEMHYVRIKMLLDNLRVCFIRSVKLILSVDPQRIFLPREIRAVFDPDLFYHRDESLYSKLLAMVAKKQNIKIEYWDNIHEEHPIISRFKILRSLSVRKVINRIGISKRTIKKFINIIRLYFTKNYLLVFSKSYDFDTLIRNFTCIYIPGNWLYELNKTNSQEMLGREIDNWDKDSNFNDFLSYKEISFGPAFFEKIRDFLSVDFNLYIKKIKRFTSRFCTGRLTIFHAGPQNFFQSYLFNQLEKSNTKIVVFQHGTYGYAKNQIVVYSDFRFNGHFLSWGDGIEEMYGGLRKGEINFVSVGSRKIEEIAEGKDNEIHQKPAIFYVPQMPHGFQGYWPFGPMNDIEYFLNKKKVLGIMGKYKEKYKLILKLQYDPKYITFTDFDFGLFYQDELKSIEIMTQPLPNLLARGDLFLIDCPSTVFIQILASGKPIVFLNDRTKYYISEENLKLLPANVDLCSSKEEFYEKIDLVMNEGIFENNSDDNRFLEKFGIHMGDPERKIVNAINDLIFRQ